MKLHLLLILVFIKYIFDRYNGYLSKKVQSNQYNVWVDDGAAQELEYDACGNIVGVMDGNRNLTKENLEGGKNQFLRKEMPSVGNF